MRIRSLSNEPELNVHLGCSRSRQVSLTPGENCANLITTVLIIGGWPLALKFVEELHRSFATWIALADKDADVRLFTGRLACRAQMRAGQTHDVN